MEFMVQDQKHNIHVRCFDHLYAIREVRVWRPLIDEETLRRMIFVKIISGESNTGNYTWPDIYRFLYTEEDNNV